MRPFEDLTAQEKKFYLGLRDNNHNELERKKVLITERINNLSQ